MGRRLGLLSLSGLAVAMSLILAGCGGGGGGDVEPTVYTAGSYHDGTRLRACYWEGTSRHELPGDGTHNAQAYAVRLAGGKVYTAGYYIGPGEVSGTTRTIPCYWEGEIRHDLQESAPYSAVARAIFVAESGTVYTAGEYGTAKNPCYWEVTSAGTSMYIPSHSAGDAAAKGIFVADGAVYVAGYYCTATESIPCYWTKLSAATPVARQDLPGSGTLDSLEMARAETILVSGGTVYTAGAYFDGTALIPCYWEALTRHDLPGGDGDFAVAKSIAVAGGAVYTAGYHFDGAQNNACYWRGTVRHELPGSGTGNSTADSIFVK